MDSQSFVLNLTPIAFLTLSSVFMAIRYFLIAGIVFWLFYKLFRSQFISRKIQTAFPKRRQFKREITSSVITILIFSGFALLIRYMRINGFTAMYTDFEAYSSLWFVCSFFLLILLHDAYFYWMHFAMHQSRWLMKFHAHHHKSFNPTPFTSLSFHPVESVFEIAFFPLIILILPVHPIALALAGTWSLLFNVLGHSGYELFRSGFLERPLLKWLNTPTHHNMHHRFGNGNYGLYFNFWDTLMKTNFKNYKRDFERVASSKKIITEHTKF
ncbi:MAG: sterol desaturase family protein [Bacteroidetes bacterium]|nr:sterol desaturase family protein [Bacteroidota bacterium]